MGALTRLGLRQDCLVILCWRICGGGTTWLSAVYQAARACLRGDVIRRRALEGVVHAESGDGVAAAMSDEARINLSKASILAIETSQHAVDTLVQICKGFEAREVHRCLTIAEAESAVRLRQVNLILIDPSVEADAGFDFIRALRASGAEPMCSVPIIALCGHATASAVARCRDTGANFMVAKPISSGALLQRIQWVARDPRPFVDLGGYVGPDRRFKFEGPPPGAAGRREGDKLMPLGEAQEPNMSQNDIDAFIKPQRVTI